MSGDRTLPRLVAQPEMARATSARLLTVAVVLAIATVAAYAPVASFNFVNFDDPEYVTANPHVRQGLTAAGIVWAFTASHAANWHPVTWLSHMLDCEVFGLVPRGHHLVNLALHVANALLFLLFLHRTTAAIWPSLLAASLFALHPLRVESVAWIAERKDVLSAFFFLLSLLSYAAYVRQPSRSRYGLVILTFLLGLMAKPMVVTLPLVLLLLDVWPLDRVPHDDGGTGSVLSSHGMRMPMTRRAETELGPAPSQYSPGFEDPKLETPDSERARAWHLLLEKAPLFAMAVVASVITYLVQRKGGAVVSSETLSLSFRAANALVAYGWYLEKTLWPSRLAVFYPLPAELTVGSVAVAALVMGGLTAVAIRVRRTYPHVAVGWLWFIVTLLPVIGLIKAGEQSTADRFTYIPHMGLFMLVAWTARDLAAGGNVQRAGIVAIGTAGVAACVAATRTQVGYWSDGTSLFQHAVAVTDVNYVAELNLGQMLMANGRPAEALEHFNEAVRLRPQWARARVNVAAALTAVGESDTAVREYEHALQLDPRDAMAHFNLGLLHAAAGATDDAIVEYQHALEVDPDYVKAHLSMGIALAAEGRRDEAIAEYERALQLDATSVVAHTNLAIALEASGRRDEAITHYTAAADAAPHDPRVSFNLGTALEQSGRPAEALRRYRDAVAAQPDFAPARLAVGNLLAQNGDRDGAANEIRAALSARPGWPEAEAALAALAQAKTEIDSPQ